MPSAGRGSGTRSPRRAPTSTTPTTAPASGGPSRTPSTWRRSAPPAPAMWATWLRVYEVTLPPGTEPVLVPGNCTAGAGGYRCATDQSFLPPGTESTVVFRVRITQVIADAAGT